MPRALVLNAKNDSRVVTARLQSSAHIHSWRNQTMRQTATTLVGFVMLLALTATGQEGRSEISVQGTGFFTQDTSGQGVSRTTTNTGGFLVGYRYHFNRWLSGEANYGYDRDTQRYFSTGGVARVQSDVYTTTAD